MQNNHQKIIDLKLLTIARIMGELIEIPYSYDVNAIKLKEQAIKNDVSSFSRNQLIKFLIQTKKTIRLIEVHNPISALIAESASVQVDGINIEYDGFWSSSLTDSTSKGKPDIEAVDISSRIKSIDDIFDTTKNRWSLMEILEESQNREFTVRSLKD